MNRYVELLLLLFELLFASLLILLIFMFTNCTGCHGYVVGLYDVVMF